MKRILCAVLSVPILAGCATLTKSDVETFSTQIVGNALAAPPADLRQAADKGNAGAQLSYSIVLRFGLNGTPPDADAADAYRRRALAGLHSTDTAIYVPQGRNSGYTQVVPITQPDIPPVIAQAVDTCVDALQAHRKAEDVTTQCGGPADYARLADSWTRARP